MRKPKQPEAKAASQESGVIHPLPSIAFPPKLEFLFRPARFKVPWGGRDAGRSWGDRKSVV